MHYARIALTLLALLTIPPAAAECQCLWQGSFVDVQDSADLLVTGRVVAGSGNSIDLEVEQILRGREGFSPLRIWLATADYCRPSRERFPPDSRWLMALTRIDEQIPGGFDPDTPNISYGRVGDYELSRCGAYWLRLSGDRVSGNLIDGTRWDYEPDMNPVLLDLVIGHLRGDVDRAALRRAAREDPALRELILDTRSFLREQP